MRIAVWHNLPSGGGNRSLFDQVRGLAGRGHHVEVWCPPTADRTFLPLNKYVREHVLPMDVPSRSTRSPVLRETIARYRTTMAKIEAMDQHCRDCAAEIDRGGFDVLLAHASQGFHPTPIGRHVNIPNLIYLAEPNRWFYEAMPRLPWMAPEPRGDGPRLGYYQNSVRDLINVHSHRILIRQELASVVGFDAILTNSLFSRESILRAYGLESQVCYLGIDVDLFRLADGPKRGYVVGLGNIAPNKRPDYAVEALGTIEESARPELVWVGNSADESYLAGLHRLAADRGVTLRHRVNIPNAELVDILGHASAMIYTSRLEPFGYAPLEANACGTAVVAIAEGGVRETIRDGINGTLIDDATPAALGRAVRDYCTDPERARTVGLAARRNVEELWSLDAALDRLEGRLHRMVAPAVP